MTFRMFFLFSIMIAVSCSKNDYFSEYSVNVPQNERSNVSVYNREIYENEIKEAYQNKDFRQAVDIAKSYYELFKETYSSRVDYFLGKSIYHLIQNSNFISEFNKLTYTERQLYKIRREKNKNKTNYIYSEWHLKHILSNHSDYFFERKVAVETLLSEINFSKDKVALKKNFKVIEYFKKFYPDAKGLSTILKDQIYFPSSLIVGKRRVKYTNYLRLFNLCKNEDVVGTPVKISGDFITVRNKNNFIHSRDISKLESWEIISFVSLSTNFENGSLWAKIIFRGNKNGFIPFKFITTNYFGEESFSDLKRFLSASLQYYNGAYIEAANEASSIIISKVDADVRERTIVLLQRCHSAIAERATSLDNKYFHYVKNHKKYFALNRETMSLYPGTLLFKFLSDLNKNSMYRHYFI